MKTVIKNVGKHVLNSARSYLNDAEHNREAMNAVHVIQKYNAQSLSYKLKNIIDDYSIEVLGSKRYAPWLYVYALVRGEFYHGWIPENFFLKLVIPRINKELMAVAGFKSFSNIVLRTNALPDIAYYVDGVFYNRQMSAIDIHQLRELATCDEGHVFVKKDCSGGGVGVLKLTPQELTVDKCNVIGNCVIQSPIKQHGFFDEIIRGSVATVRITTVKDTDGRIDLRAAFLCLGRKDTPWVQSNNFVRVAIINSSGELDAFCYTQDWRRYSSHPDSNFPFANRRIPKFKEAVRLCVELHRKVPHFTIVGWDVAVRENEEIAIMEWSSNRCDIKFSEATTGPCFLGLNWEKHRDRGVFGSATGSLRAGGP
jgi:hypothetical protein